MPKKKYIVKLTTEERFQLKKIINAERMAAHKRRKARILLKIDQGLEGPGWTDGQAATAFDCRRQTVERLRQRLVDRGFESVLSRQCMKDYFENRQQLADAIAAWERSRNKNKSGIDWRFTTADARIKLKKLYPTI